MLLILFAFFSSCLSANIPTNAPCYSADIIYKNATFHTLTPSPPLVEAVAVKLGKIVAVGSFDALNNQCLSEQTQVVDLNQAAVFPGFINTYAHFTLYGWLADNALDLSTNNPFQNSQWQPTKSLEVFLTKIKKHLASDQQQLYVYGYDASRMSGPKLSQQHLDKLSKQIPITVFYSHGQYIQLNQAAINALKKNENTKNIHVNYEGGISGTDLQQYLEQVISEASLQKAQQTASKLFAQNGFTTVLEVQPIHLSQTKSSTTDMDKPNQAIELIPLQSIDTRKTPYDFSASTQKPVSHMLVVDGLAQHFKAYLKKPYINPPEPYGKSWRGTLSKPASEINAQILKSLESHTPISILVHGDAAIDFLIKALDAINVPARIFNGLLISPQQLKQLKAQNIGISYNPASLYFWGESLCQSRLGAERAINILPYQSTIKEFGYVVTHLDTPSTPPAAIDAINWMSTRAIQRWNYPANRTCPQYFNINERINSMDALLSFTKNAANFFGIGDFKGTIELGKDADLTILSNDPTQSTGQPIVILGTIKKGHYFPITVHQKAPLESVLMKIEELEQK